jgi:hypothetical protein
MRSDENPALAEAFKLAPEREVKTFTAGSIMAASKEVILVLNKDQFEMTFVGYVIDAARGCLVLAPSWQALELDDEGVKNLLASAISHDIPVYPNDDAAASQFARLYASLYTDGFISEIDGKKIRYEWTGVNRGITYDDASGKWKVEPTESVFPADTLALAMAVNERQESTAEAVRILAGLRAGIDELARLLDKPVRDEGSLQRCLTRFPVLFGLHYRRVIPKYKLGSDFEMDFALELTTGLVDLVEIEPSCFPLYTRAGNPRAELVHAEQQVLDWLEWLEANARLARDDFPGLMRPVGQVIIGRRDAMSHADRKRLRQRNAIWQGSVVISTYDDLLDRARNTLAILMASNRDSESEVGPNE